MFAKMLVTVFARFSADEPRSMMFTGFLRGWDDWIDVQCHRRRPAAPLHQDHYPATAHPPITLARNDLRPCPNPTVPKSNVMQVTFTQGVDPAYGTP